MEDKYREIINLPHHRSKKRKPMSMLDRAAQFGAFRALTGYEDAISETGRLTSSRLELDEYQKAELDRRLQRIRDEIAAMPRVSVTYFVPDEKKDGGEYVTHTGAVRRLQNGRLVFCDGTVVGVEEVIGATLL